MVYEGLSAWEKQQQIERAMRKEISERVQSKSGESEYVVKKLKSGVQLIYYPREGGRWHSEDRVFIPDELVERNSEMVVRIWKTEAPKETPR
jgi:hypothetical protein